MYEVLLQYLLSKSIFSEKYIKTSEAEYFDIQICELNYILDAWPITTDAGIITGIFTFQSAPEWITAAEMGSFRDRGAVVSCAFHRQHLLMHAADNLLARELNVNSLFTSQSLCSLK